MHRRVLGLAVAMIVGVGIVSASGAATTKAQRVTRIDVSTRAAVIHYLRAIHVNPKGAVIQRGALNYAGAGCPGGTWKCASTRHTVVQIAKPGGQNRFACRSARCVVVQLVGVSHGVYAVGRASTVAPLKGGGGGSNTGVCIKTSGLGASCTISQSGTGNNTAVVYENANKQSGLTQTASYTASITQQTSGTGMTNTACVDQVLFLVGSTTLSGKKAQPINVTLEAHQSITINQDAPNGSNNASQDANSSGACTGSSLTQTQTLTSNAGGLGASSVTQNEDAASNGANLSLDIEQNQGSGFGSPNSQTNNATFTQKSDLEAVAFTPSGATVNQTQSTSVGGILGTVNQDSHGVSTANATQTELQCEDADVSTTADACPSTASEVLPAVLNQNQVGPVKKGSGTALQTGGNTGDSFLINQSSTQSNDTGSGQSNTVQGDCSTPGSCTDSQTTTVDGTTTNNTQTGQNVNTQTTCSGSVCTSSGPTTTGTLTLLPNGLSVANADVAEFGYGGMRGTGTGSINVSGVTGPVLHAFLYWNGPTNSTDPSSNASVTFNGTPISGTNIGTANNNCWGFTNSQSYSADVTSLVAGNGSYPLSNFMKTDQNNNDIDINGVALIVFYDDGNSANDRNLVLWNGNDSNIAFGTDPGGWNETISGVQYPGSGSAALDTVVSDGQGADDPALVVNSTTLAPDGSIFQGNTTPHGSFAAGDGGDLWDVKSFDITSLLTTGSNTLNITSADPLTLGSPPTSPGWDCISLVVAAANVPASAPPVILQAPIAAPKQNQEPAPVAVRPAPTAIGGRDGVVSP